jgi:hypothetical protein
MKFLHKMSIALYAGVLLTELSNEMVEGALEWGRDGCGVRRGGPLDMRLGKIVRASGFLGGARYYVPEIKTVSEIALDNGGIKWSRKYGKDWAAATGEMPCLLQKREMQRDIGRGITRR